MMRVNIMKKILVAICLMCSASLPSRAAEVVVAAASDLGFAVKEIITDFERETGNKVRLSLGSSGTFAAQISNGAPFDVFLSADIAYPQDLDKKGFAEPNTTFVYALGRIVVWVPKNSPVDVEKLGMQSLLDPSVRKIAIANPEHAPYGRAAVSSMEHFGLYQAVKNKLVLGENISQASQFVQSGAAQLGIIAQSIALSDPMRATGRYWQVPPDAYPRMDQAGVVLKQARKAGHLDAARAFVDALRAPHGQAILQRYGFSLPTPTR
jgi:molybdate transport system substrate-binding protein